MTIDRRREELIHLMAHAPKEPQEWFEPVMECERPAPPRASNAVVCKYRDRSGFIEEDDSDEYKAYVAVRDVWERDAWKWDMERLKQRMIQWPRAWAEAVLADLNKGAQR